MYVLLCGLGLIGVNGYSSLDGHLHLTQYHVGLALERTAGVGAGESGFVLNTVNLLYPLLIVAVQNVVERVARLGLDGEGDVGTVGVSRHADGVHLVEHDVFAAPELVDPAGRVIYVDSGDRDVLAVVELEDGVVKDYYLLTHELEHTEWIGGDIVLKKDENGWLRAFHNDIMIK